MRSIRNTVTKARSFLMRKEAEALGIIYNPKLRQEGSAVIGEVIVLVVIIVLAVALKNGGLIFITDIWTKITANSDNLWN